MLKIEYIQIEDIKPYKRNAKKHPPAQVEQIAESIKQMGFNDPIAIWHGEIVEGHGRYLAAKSLGMTTLPVIRLDDLTDEQRKAYTLIHNKLTMNSGFDMELLSAELAEISSIDMTALFLKVQGITWCSTADACRFQTKQNPQQERGGKNEQSRSPLYQRKESTPGR